MAKNHASNYNNPIIYMYECECEGNLFHIVNLKDGYRIYKFHVHEGPSTFGFGDLSCGPNY